MSGIADQLSSSRGQRGETANIALARKITAAKDHTSITELIRLLQTGNTPIQNDAVKVLYEIGAEAPQLISDYVGVFLAFLDNQNNRLQWGAMTALGSISRFKPEVIVEKLPEILAAAKKGSVITKDNAIGILVKLSAAAEYRKTTVPSLMEILRTAAANQFAMYAELAASVLDGTDLVTLREILEKRIKNLPKASQQKRIEKLIRKITPTP